MPRVTCSSGQAVLVDAQSFVVVNGCPYAYYAQYECNIVASTTPTTVTTTTTQVPVNFVPLPASHRCMDQPPQGWANLGTGLTQVQCHDQCVALESCNFVNFWSANGACTSFEACHSTVSQTWTKVSGSERRLRNAAQTWAKILGEEHQSILSDPVYSSTAAGMKASCLAIVVLQTLLADL